jgi:hypothetical protein
LPPTAGGFPSINLRILRMNIKSERHSWYWRKGNTASATDPLHGGDSHRHFSLSLACKMSLPGFSERLDKVHSVTDFRSQIFACDNLLA